jgi:S1-C subfamily serine protease
MNTHESTFSRPISPAARVVQLSGWVLFGLVLVAGWRLREPTQSLHSSDATARPVTPRGNLEPDELATIEIFERYKASVVQIATSELVRSGGYFSYDVVEVPRGSGSGFIWSKDGYIVTNYHVIADSKGVAVALADGKDYEATVVGADPDHDVAVLKIDADSSAMVPLQIGTSADLHVGQKVLAIGYPYGLDWTLTTGIISGLDRSIQSIVGTLIHGVIQTDAAINPGNSGGPLLDSSGRLIGINAAILSPSGSSAGIGFAVPVDTVNRIVPQIIRSGRPERGALGVRVLPDSAARRLGVEGVVIDEVLPGSAAEHAGLQSRKGSPLNQKDVIVSVDGQKVSRQDELFDLLREHDPGDRIPVEVLRAGRKVRLEVVLQELR